MYKFFLQFVTMCPSTSEKKQNFNKKYFSRRKKESFIAIFLLLNVSAAVWGNGSNDNWTPWWNWKYQSWEKWTGKADTRGVWGEK